MAHRRKVDVTRQTMTMHIDDAMDMAMDMDMDMDSKINPNRNTNEVDMSMERHKASSMAAL